MAPSCRIVMLGTGDFALPTFVHLCATGHRVERVVTQPDRPQGRKQELIPSAIKKAALERGIPVDQPENVNALESLDRIRGLGPDLLVTAAYGQILKPEVLAAAKHGGINVHASLLPKYRGAAPIAWAIYHGEKQTGVTIIQMTPRLDAGGMLLQEVVDIGAEETAGDLEARLAPLGATLALQAIGQVVAGTACPVKQDQSQVTRAPKLKKEDGLIDWGRNRYNEEVCAGEFGGIGCEVQMRMGNVARLDLARAVAAGLELGNACAVYVEADDRRVPSAEGDSDRQPDISETDNGELATVRHDLPFDGALMQIGLSYPVHDAIRNGRFNQFARANADRARPRRGRYARSRTSVRPVRGRPCRTCAAAADRVRGDRWPRRGPRCRRAAPETH